jgi:hypothetical protein
MNDAKTKKVRVFACGGAGINVINSLTKKLIENKDSDTIEKLLPYFIDTSDSNTIDNDKDLSFDGYLIDGLDGSGQKRDLNASIISDNIKSTITGLEDTDLTIVVHSLSGGSGSVIGPLLTKELISKEKAVIVLAIGDMTTGKFANNTLATLKTYENISELIAAPINMVYFQNVVPKNKEESKNEITVNDTYIIETLYDLIKLGSKRYFGLDTKDIYHFLNYHLVSSVTPRLSILNIIDKNDRLPDKYGSIITAITLHCNDDEIHLYDIPEAQYVGEEKNPHSDSSYVIHYIISDRFFDDLVAKINGVIKDISERKNIKPARKSIIDKSSDKVSDDNSGLVF